MRNVAWSWPMWTNLFAGAGTASSLLVFASVVAPILHFNGAWEGALLAGVAGNFLFWSLAILGLIMDTRRLTQ